MGALFADENLDAMRSDSQLAEVTFVDAAHGWAVGDRGAIWATTDGGERWRLQASGVDCRLSTVVFLDARRGWAAGGMTAPGDRAGHGASVSQGVLLATRDGGEHWSQDRKLLLPAIESLAFFDPLHGWAITRASSLFPTNLFTTDDGGHSWTPLPSADGVAWTTGFFADPLSGAVAGPSGALAAVRRRAVERSRFSDPSLRQWHRLRAGGAPLLWAVGDGAWIFQSGDLGRSWLSPRGALDGAYRDLFDFHAIATQGAQAWIAGSPGSRVFHSPDAGQSWTAEPTGSPTAIRGLTFVDAEHGWAVGDLGTILATSDGGHTWRRQRSPASRAAVLGCFSAARHLPLELLARLSADEGYLSAAIVCGRHDLDGAATAADSEATIHEAVVAAGGSAGERDWRFPMRQTELRLGAERVVEGLDRASDSHGLARLEARLVADIRRWRPTLIVTADASDDAAEQLVSKTVLAAVEHAADPTWYSEQLTLAGLAPWATSRVVAAAAPGGAGTLSVEISQLAPRLGRSYVELAGAGHELLMSLRADDRSPVPRGPRPRAARTRGRAVPRATPLRLAIFLAASRYRPVAMRGACCRLLRRGISNRSSGPLRHAATLMHCLPGPTPLGPQPIPRRARQTTLHRPPRATPAGWPRPVRWSRRSSQRRPPPCSTGWPIAIIIAASGNRRPSSANCWSSVIRAIRWRLRRSCGSRSIMRVARLGIGLEADKGWWLKRSPPRRRAPDARPPRRFDGVKPAVAHEPLGETRELTTAGAAGLRPDGWPALAAARGKQLEQLSPQLFAEPFVRFPLAAALRGEGLPRQAER